MFNKVLRAKIQEHMSDELIHILERNPLKTDRAGVLIAKELSRDVLDKLITRKVCAIHIPGYFSKSVACKADNWILKNGDFETWNLGKNPVKTDVEFGIGFPREQASRSRKNQKRYMETSLRSIRKVREAFAPMLSPIDRLRLELSELWTNGTLIDPFKGKTGFVGIVRVLRPSTLFNGIAGRNGVCHFDSRIKNRVLSANLYLNMPVQGGELRIWNIQLNKKTEKHPVYEFIGSKAFDPDVREVIQYFLPKPLVINPKAGDLILIDTARPHAVGGGFTKGHRTSLQCFIHVEHNSANPRLILRS